MQSLVELQAPFSYSVLYIVLGLIICLIPIGYLEFKKRYNKKEEIVDIVVESPNEDNTTHIKEKYIKKLIELEENINKNKISIRHAYQTLSSIIRLFVYEMTKIKVQNYSLQDITKLNMPELTELIKEYYEPEFSVDSVGNIKKSIEKTRKVIEKWS